MQISIFPLDQITKPVQNASLWEAGIAFGVAIVLILTGTCLIVWAFLSLNSHVLAAAKAVAGTLVGGSGGYLVKVRREARDQLDRIRRDENVKTMIRTMGEGPERNKLILEFSQNQMNPQQKQGFWKRLF